MTKITDLIETDNKTICAIATTEGTSALGIVRLSGPLAHHIVNKIFKPTSNECLLPRRVYFGKVFDKERLIDDVIVHISIAPFSFTGEDCAEISCHGSSYVLHEVMSLAMENGATPALPGEFTQRAFLNGKIDLAQAEAIADLIASENEAAHRVAIQQMRGGFSLEISKLRSALIDFTSLIELELDFGEEDVQFADRNQLQNILDQLHQTITTLISSFSLGNVLKNGVPTAIVGATNVGKSTLLNALLGEERAIVSDTHGTTRDTIEEEVTIDGIRFRLTDTAGIRNPNEEIEQLGIKRSLQKIRSASLLLLTLDATQPNHFQGQILNIANKIDPKVQQIIIVVNKSDLCNNNQISNIISSIISETNLNIFSISIVSAKNKTGIEELKTTITSAIRTFYGISTLLPQNTTIITNIRHLHALKESQKSLDRVGQGISSAIPLDLVAHDLRQALYHLGTITGEVTTEEILGSIFGKFCIGK